MTLAAKPQRQRLLLPGTAAELPERLSGRTLLPAPTIRGLSGIAEALFDRLLGQGAFTWYELGPLGCIGLLDLREVLLELAKHPAPPPFIIPESKPLKPAPARSRAKRKMRKEKEAWMVDIAPPPLAADPVGHWSDAC